MPDKKPAEPPKPATLPPGQREITVTLKVPPDAVPHYATNFLLQGAVEEHILSYFFAKLPDTLDPKEQATISTIPSVFLGQMVMTRDRLVQLYGLVKAHLTKIGALPK